MARRSKAGRIYRAIGAATVGFGVVPTVAPTLFTKLYGLGDEPRMRAFVRLWGTRNLALGTVMLRQRDHRAQRELLQLTAVTATVDTVGIAGAAGVPAGPRILGATTAAGFAAAAFYALQAD